MTYVDDMASETAWNQQSGAPGKPSIARTHPAFKRGQHDHYQGQNECPYGPGGEAARHWHAGQRHAASWQERYADAISQDQRDQRRG